MSPEVLVPSKVSFIYMYCKNHELLTSLVESSISYLDIVSYPGFQEQFVYPPVEFRIREAPACGTLPDMDVILHIN